MDNGLEMAANNGELEILKWLCEHYSQDCTVWLRGLKFGFQDFASTRWLLETYSDIALRQPGGDLTKSLDIKIVNWAVEDFPWKSHFDRTAYVGRFIAIAAKRRDLCWLEYLWSYRDSENDNIVIEHAAASVQLQTIQWLQKHLSTGLSSDALHVAIENGHLVLSNGLMSSHISRCHGLRCFKQPYSCRPMAA